MVSVKLFVIVILDFNRYSSTVFYPTIAAIFDRNRPAVYTIAIYGRLYMAE